jgi:hypothetical protein
MVRNSPCIFLHLRGIPDMVPVALVKRYTKLAFLACILSLLLAYLGDYAIVRLRIADKRNALFGTVEVMSATPLKNGRVAIYPNPKPEGCLHSLFPHLGYEPCWYLARSPIKLIGWQPGSTLYGRIGT